MGADHLPITRSTGAVGKCGDLQIVIGVTKHADEWRGVNAWVNRQLPEEVALTFRPIAGEFRKFSVPFGQD
jgi:hypothetical protein